MTDKGNCDSQFGGAAPQRCGFRVMEFVIFALVLGITAAVVVPQFSHAETSGQTAKLRRHVSTVRAQLQRYHDQHDQTWPGSELIAVQMTTQTDASGQPQPDAPAGTHLGPYLICIPDNPVTGGNGIGSGPAGTSDWYYNGETGEFRANHVQSVCPR